MKSEKNRKTSIIIDLVIRTTCESCSSVRLQLEHITRKFSDSKLRVIDADKENSFPGKSQPYVTPAVWVNDRLWYLGGFDSNSFEEKLNKINSEV